MTSSPRRHLLPLAAGLTAFLVLVSGGAAWSSWSAQSRGPGTVTTDAVAVSHAGFASPATTTYLPSSLSSTRSFTVTNNSAVQGTATVSITSSGTAASGLPISVWTVSSADKCTSSTSVPASGVTKGTWASATLTPTLAAGAIITYCVRTSIPDWKAITDPVGGNTVNPALTVSLNAQGWVATAPTATHAQTTAGMYPLVTGNFFDPKLASTWHTIRRAGDAGLCLDVAASGGAGTRVITWTCHDQSNQRWQFLPVNGTNQTLVTVRPRHAPTTRLTYTSSGVQQIAAGATGAAAQQWYVQKAGAGFFQLVSAATGKCLGMSAAGDADMSVVECNDVRARLAFQREALTMSMSSSGTAVMLDFHSISSSGTLVLQRLRNGSWENVTSIVQGAGGVSFDMYNVLTNDADTSLRIVFQNTTDTAYSTFVLHRSTNTVTVVSGIG
ncbi:RICIN domain-containing protein [Microbacterium sp. KUDC0406]|uniref:RICIN domain-containing protein n=1 Tax=Microbacterium sp. KUDC0406 TaxID=2909588 RepID=UPI001F161000|nr:RICIN domain-containing protein [Microbacterium sp. KUDC0406]UJP10265.1 RICIN domain-containing protein [Microbacterium sp. KUDC0406]